MENPFILEKGIKTGYYKDTPENRQKGRVGQKYTITVTDDPKKNRIQQQLDAARARVERTSLSERAVKDRIERHNESDREQDESNKKYLEERGGIIGEDWKLSDNRIRAIEMAELDKEVKKTTLDTYAEKQDYVNAYEKDRDSRIASMEAMKDSIFRDPTNEIMEEQFAWAKTKDLEIVRDFDRMARMNNITQKLPVDLIEESVKPALDWYGGNEAYVDPNPSVNMESEGRRTFKDHKESEVIWKEDESHYNKLNSPAPGLHGPLGMWNQLPTIDFLGAEDQRKDFLTRLPVLDLRDNDAAAGLFLTKPFQQLEYRSLDKQILNKDKKYGSIIVSTSDGDLLMTIKKVGYGVNNPKSKKKAAIVSRFGFKMAKLKNPIDNLNYDLPVSTAEPIKMELIDRTEDDDIRDMKEQMKGIKIISLQREIDEMEALPPYEQDEDELDALYFRRNKYYELEMLLEKMQEPKE